MSWCAVVNCTNNSRKKQDKIFFSLPKDPKKNLPYKEKPKVREISERRKEKDVKEVSGGW